MPSRFEDACQFLMGRINFEKVPPGQRDFKLDRMKELLGALGNPHLAIPAIHIAGTKGKGSTCAMVERMLREAGFRCGLFTSPHLISFEERIAVGGKFIEPEMLVLQISRVREAMTSLDSACAESVTYFEILTAVAWLEFLRQKCHFAVMEVGLGGRLDSTNLCRPLVTVITSISRDHAKILGETLAEIAAEKGGIIKQQVPLVSGVTNPEARDVIRRIASEKQAPLWELHREIVLQDRYDHDRPSSQICVQTPERIHPGLQVPLRGAHQAANAALAVAAVDLLIRQGMAIDPAAMVEGLRQVELPGRIEVVSRHPTIIFDTSHNEESLKALLRTLRENFRPRQRILVFACSRDKEPERLLPLLAGEFDRVILTEFHEPKRVCSASQLYELAHRLPGMVNLEVIPDSTEAYRRAKSLAGPQDMVVLAGSFYLIGEIRVSENFNSPCCEKDG